MKKVYERLGTYSLEEIEAILKQPVLDNLDLPEDTTKDELFHPKGPFIDFYGHKITITSGRYRTFFINGTSCKRCNLEGSFWALERDDPNHLPHLNLYGIRRTAKNEDMEILMTKDHIIPKSLGGPDDYRNYQNLCMFCNCSKASKINKEELLEQLDKGLELNEPMFLKYQDKFVSITDTQKNGIMVRYFTKRSEAKKYHNITHLKTLFVAAKRQKALFDGLFNNYTVEKINIFEEFEKEDSLIGG